MPLGMLKLTRNLTIGFAVVFVLSLLTGMVAWYNMQRASLYVAKVERSYDGIAQLRRVHRILLDMQNCRRGYRLTGDNAYLKKYRQNRLLISPELQALEPALQSLDRQSRLPKLRYAVGDLVAFWDGLNVDLYKLSQSQREEATTAEELKAAAVFDILEAVAVSEKSVLAENKEASERVNRINGWQLAANIIIIEGIIFILVVAIRREFHKRRITERNMKRQLSAVQRLNQVRDEKNWFLQGITTLRDAIQESASLNELAQACLQNILRYTNSMSGAFYIIEPDGSSYRRYAGIGLAANAPEVYQKGQGLPGTAALTANTIRTGTVVEDYLRIDGGLISGQLVEVLLVPFCQHKDVIAVVEIGSLQPYPPQVVTLLEEVGSSVAVAISAVLAGQRADDLLTELHAKTEALEQQQEELQQINDALTEQARALQESQQVLQSREATLREVNKELELQNDKLEATREALVQQATALERSNRYKSEFLANMSHELRTPLNAILILARLLEDGANVPLEKQMEYASIIHRSGEDLLSLINDILDLSKIEAGKIELDVGTIRTAELAQNLRDLFTVQAEERGLEFTVTLEPSCPETILSDEQRVAQILRNLISNALKFTDSGGLVEASFSGCTTANAPPALCVSVKDTGIGIPLEQQHQIFEAFQQADGTVSRKYGGTGLGLSISRELARLLGGSLTVQSKPGEGSTFTMYVPIRHEASTASTLPQLAVADDREVASTPDKPIALIAEDDPAFAAALRDAARGQGFQALVALDGHQAKEILIRQSPAVLVLDMNLPGIDGWQILRFLRQSNELRKIPVHVVSSSPQPIPEGPIAFSRKPLNSEATRAIFEELAERISHKIPAILILSDPRLPNTQKLQDSLGERGITVDSVAILESNLSNVSSLRWDSIMAVVAYPERFSGQYMEQIASAAPQQLHWLLVCAQPETCNEQDWRRKLGGNVVVIQDSPARDERLADQLVNILAPAPLPDVPENSLKAAAMPIQLPAGKTALLVDDDMRNVFALSVLLQSAGLEVLVAGNGAEALQQLEEHPEINLVLLDVMMPVMDGNETLLHIRKDPRWKDLPVMMLTAKAMKEDTELCLSNGANACLTKPVDQRRLLDTLLQWLS